MLYCKSCADRWKEILIKQQLNDIVMAKNNQKETEGKAVETTSVNSSAKPNINKIVEDRRKVLLDSKQVNK